MEPHTIHFSEYEKFGKQSRAKGYEGELNTGTKGWKGSHRLYTF